MAKNSSAVAIGDGDISRRFVRLGLCSSMTTRLYTPTRRCYPNACSYTSNCLTSRMAICEASSADVKLLPNSLTHHTTFCPSALGSRDHTSPSVAEGILLQNRSIRDSGLPGSTNGFRSNGWENHIQSELFDQPMETDSLRRQFGCGIAKSHGKQLNDGLSCAESLSRVDYTSISCVSFRCRTESIPCKESQGINRKKITFPSGCFGCVFGGALKLLFLLGLMVRALGLEPRTNALKGRCSTN